MDTYLGRAKWGPNGTRSKTSDANWKLPLKWNRQAEKEGKRLRVFCSSLSDVFEDWDGAIVNHKGRQLWQSDELRSTTMADLRRDLFELVDATPHLDWLLLTKRPENIRRMWPDCQPCNSSIVCKRGDGIVCPDDECDRDIGIARHRPNCWIGTSVATQADADQNIPELLKCRDLAPVLFVSAEPILGPIDFLRTPRPGETWDWLTGERETAREKTTTTSLDWIIVGAESGHGRRATPLEAITGVVDQCQAAAVRCFVKQDTAQHPGQQGRIPDDYWAVKQFPEVIR